MKKVPDSGTFCGVGGDNGFDKKRVFITSVMNTRSGCGGDFCPLHRRKLPASLRQGSAVQNVIPPESVLSLRMAIDTDRL